MPVIKLNNVSLLISHAHMILLQQTLGHTGVSKFYGQVNREPKCDVKEHHLGSKQRITPFGEFLRTKILCYSNALHHDFGSL